MMCTASTSSLCYWLHPCAVISTDWVVVAVAGGITPVPTEADEVDELALRQQ